MDIFERTILCNKCEERMQKVKIVKNGFGMRGLACPSGHDKIIHPDDLVEFEKFKELRRKDFKVKMRIVSNSYAISIPKEIVSFMQEQEAAMNDMGKLCFEDAGRVTVRFNVVEKKDE